MGFMSDQLMGAAACGPSILSTATTVKGRASKWVSPCLRTCKQSMGAGDRVAHKLAAIRCDYGPEYIAQTLVEWANRPQITLMYTQPGKPMQNAYIELFNRAARLEWLALEFVSVARATAISEKMAQGIKSRVAKYGHRRCATRGVATRRLTLNSNKRLIMGATCHE